MSDFTRRAYGTNYIETLRVQIHANCRIRRIYFSDRLYTEDELPPEFKLFLPVAGKPQPAAGALDVIGAELEALGVWEAGVVPGIDKRLVVIDLGRAVVKVLAQALVRVVVPLL